MVNVSFLALALATTIATVNACERTCSLDSESGGYCYYSCWQACSSLSETTARNNFGKALRRAGHDCVDTGANGEKCKKTSSFGSCGSHYWNCGSGC